MILHTDRVVILGAGIAALTAALRLAPRPVLVVSPEALGGGASSAWAQGGVAAAIAAGDDPRDHAADTMRAGAGIVDPGIAAMVTAAAAEQVAMLAELGVPFDRDASGAFCVSREAAHGRPRVVRVLGDQAGAAIMGALVRAVLAAPSIQVLEGAAAGRLLRGDDGRVRGVRLHGSDGRAGALNLHAPAVLMAAGGAAGLFAVTTNPARIMGQALGMALRAGAVAADAEFVQFHPTAIASGEDPAPLATEALRGEGAILVNAGGERFMAACHPDAELAPRDVVARAVYDQTRAGQRPALDTRKAVGSALTARFPAVAAACARAGIDPRFEPIPVAAAAHYHMGGIATDASGQSSLPGLWACGEAASTGLHGANRLASNGLLEALVMAERAAASIAGALGPAGDAAVPVTEDFDTWPADGSGFESGSECAPDPETVATLRRLMTDHVGLHRDAACLRRALDGLGTLSRAARGDALANMIAAATAIAASALVRRESRGGHFRADFPQPDPAQARRSTMTLAQAVALRDPKEAG